ncbi:MAG TPA: peptide chain release factor N(5)-glutamine methyltransferase [Microlunatus sp.]|nr:peptide chain release factor N(5)-glutamine methyltransferase [Microlunatus sp.]
MSTARDLTRDATATLTAAGVESPGTDARRLLAYVLGMEPASLLLDPVVDPDQRARYTRLVARRAAREPLQHLTGRAYFRHLELAVGPGVFVPRPETEVMTGWAIDRLRELRDTGPELHGTGRELHGVVREPFAVDLCSGSGAIAAALASEVPGVRVAAVERSPEAAEYARRNLAGSGAELIVADMTDVPRSWDETVDLVIANPPYIPLEAFSSVAPEARDHDPAEALFSGDDGLDAIRTLVGLAARLLVDGGLLCFEHADLQGESAPAVVLASAAFVAVRDRRDLTDRPRFVTAIRRDRRR